MLGATIVTKKNPRRVGVPATVKGKTNPEYAAAIGPTLERLSRAGDNFTVGGDERTGRRYFIHDEPLDRALKKRIISGAEHSALRKYFHHWYHGGQAPAVGSIDLNRIFASEGGSVPGMPASEAQVFHRQRWREGREVMGHRGAIVVDNVVCYGWKLEIAGYAVGYHSQPSAIRGAGRLLSEAGGILAKHWGIG
jgi:hypothetical protein